ncbi:hypothetical protein HOD96_02940 [Candidatus Falkowbacteria bacterium]|nr:hypothetical protein [Candidatus Falkowbacteria bacterium]MBT4432782.1 hypothetical protein [Candidatus Falkowbacteria bacterium]
MNNNFYFQALTNSWKLVWKNKILWFFGLFAIFLGGVEWSNLLSRDFLGMFKINSVVSYLSSIGVFSGEFLLNIKAVAVTNPFSLVMILFIFGIFIALFVALLWVSVVSQGSLVYSVFELDHKTKINTFKSMAIGRQNFWQILSLNIVDKYVVWTCSILLGFFGTEIFIQKSALTAITLLIISVLILVILVLTAFIIKYALAFVVLKAQNPFLAIKNAFILFFRNLLINIEMAAFLFLVNYVFRILAIWIVVILMIPLTSLGSFSLYLSGGISFGFYAIFIPFFISVLLLWFFSILTAYNYSIWTLMFMSLTGDRKTSSSIIKKYIGKIIKKS